MNQRHLLSAGIALVLLVALLAGGFGYVRAQDDAYVYALSGRVFHQKARGMATSQLALEHPDLLLFYGSSELFSAEATPYNPRNLFAGEPTGFSLFAVGDVSVNSLLTAQEIAGLGSALRGRKILISISPAFFAPGGLPQDHYAGNFSRLNAGDLLFSTDLSYDLRQSAAREMLRYPDTLAQDPVLDFAARQLASPSPLAPLLYDAALPLGKLQTLILQLQDYWAVYSYIQSHPTLVPGAPQRTPATIDWAALQTQAEQAYRKHADNNPFGIDNQTWLAMLAQSAHPGDDIPHVARDMEYDIDVAESPEWTDLDILLRELRQLGAEPLLLNIPIDGTYTQLVGMRPATRAAYYGKLTRMANSYGVPVLTFQDHDMDPYFLMGPLSHPSEKGWSYFDQAIDAFYHDRLPLEIDK